MITKKKIEEIKQKIIKTVFPENDAIYPIYDDFSISCPIRFLFAEFLS